jgi:hypothetical protein
MNDPADNAQSLKRRRIFQIASTIAWILVVGGSQVMHNLHPDPE